jgi:hypothetical protein
MPESENLGLANLDRGGALEAFDHALGSVIANILDPNTPAEQAREIVLRVKIKPDENRDMGKITYQATSKLAPVQARSVNAMLAKDKGRAVARELRHNEPPVSDNVTELRRTAQ